MRLLPGLDREIWCCSKSAAIWGTPAVALMQSGRRLVTLQRHSSVRTFEAGCGRRFKRVEYLSIDGWTRATPGRPRRSLIRDHAAASRPVEVLSRLSRHRTRPWSMRASGTANVGTITSG
jgi:hypothetical protein